MMKIKILNVLTVIIILFISCKKDRPNKIKVKNNTTTKINKITQQVVPLLEQENFVNRSVNKADSITSNQNLLEISTKYKKQDTTYWVEGAEFKNNKEKVIYYGSSYYDKDNVSYDANYTFLINKKGFLSLISKELSKGLGSERKIILKDTFFFKNNKIYFWKNKNASRKELLKKEKEILAIKKEIDSIMAW